MNEKAFYRFVEFTGKLCGYDIPHETYKLISLDRYMVQTKEETKVRRLADSFRYLLGSTGQMFDGELIETSYFLLTKSKPDPDLAERLIRIYYQNKDSSAFRNAVLLHLEIAKSGIPLRTEYAMMVSSFALAQKGYSPVIVYESDRSQYLENVSGSKESELYSQFLMLEHQTRTTLEEEGKPFSTTVDDVLNAVRESRETLTGTFRIRHMYLYGSMAKNTATPTSDADFLVVFEEPLLVFERNELMAKCRDFLETKIKARVDLLEYGYSIDRLELIEAEKARQLF